MTRQHATPIRLARNLAFPTEVVTQTLAVLAKRRAGKSYFARRFAEQLWRAKQQIVILDPKGDWWGILSSRDGKSPGLPIVIFGGARGHVPLEPGSGQLVAELVVGERLSALLDLSEMRKHERATFCADFLETLYRLKSQERYRTALMLIIDEADAVAPQQTKNLGVRGGNVERMLGAAEDIVRRGGQRGLGCMLVTQRSAVLNKNVLTQTEILITLRTIAPQDLDAMQAWIDVHGTDEQRKTLRTSLPSLPIGNAWVWSPGWPTDDGLFERIEVLPIETYDSFATPKPGERRREPKTVAEVDLDAVRKQMAATLKNAAQRDPKALQKRVAELEAQVRPAPAPAAAPAKPPKTIEVPIFKDGHLQRLEQAIDRMRVAVDDLREFAASAVERLEVRPAAAAPAPAITAARLMPSAMQAAKRVRAVPPPAPARPAAAKQAGDLRIGAGHMRMLQALAQAPSGFLSRTQLAVRSGYASSGGSFANLLGALRSAGLVVGNNARLELTDAGRALGPFEQLPTGRALYDYWFSGVGLKCSAEILRVLFEQMHSARPKPLTAEEIAARTVSATGGPYEATGGSFMNGLGKVRTLELVHGDRTTGFELDEAFREGQ